MRSSSSAPPLLTPASHSPPSPSPSPSRSPYLLLLDLFSFFICISSSFSIYFSISFSFCLFFSMSFSFSFSFSCSSAVLGLDPSEYRCSYVPEDTPIVHQRPWQKMSTTTPTNPPQIWHREKRLLCWQAGIFGSFHVVSLANLTTCV